MRNGDINPDDTYPFLQKDIIGSYRNGRKTPQHKSLSRKTTSSEFQAILWKDELRDNSAYCWTSLKGGAPRFSQKILKEKLRNTKHLIDKTELNAAHRTKNANTLIEAYERAYPGETPPSSKTAREFLQKREKQITAQ